MALADVVKEISEPAAFIVTGNRDIKKISERVKALVATAEKTLQAQGFPKDRIVCELYLNCRYSGSSTQLMVELPQDGDVEKVFVDQHRHEFGFNLERDILVDDIRIRAVGKSLGSTVRSPYADFDNATLRPYDASSFESKQVYFEGSGWIETQVVPLLALKEGEQVRVSYSVLFYDCN